MKSIVIACGLEPEQLEKLEQVHQVLLDNYVLHLENCICGECD